MADGKASAAARRLAFDRSVTAHSLMSIAALALRWFLDQGLDNAKAERVTNDVMDLEYVTTGSFGHLFLVDPTKNAAVASLEVGQRPWGVALLPDGKTAYTANGPSNDVSVIDLATKAVVKKIAVGQRPWGIAIVSSR